MHSVTIEQLIPILIIHPPLIAYYKDGNWIGCLVMVFLNVLMPDCLVSKNYSISTIPTLLLQGDTQARPHYINFLISLQDFRLFVKLNCRLFDRICMELRSYPTHSQHAGLSYADPSIFLRVHSLQAFEYILQENYEPN